MVKMYGSHPKRLTNLRISVTDRCNFRYSYCAPKQTHHPSLNQERLLSFAEILRLARLFSALGVNKIRVTGGEPLLRPHIEELIAELTQLPGLELALTTNGILLPEKVNALKQAGLKHLNICLDALEADLFHDLSSGRHKVEEVLQGIQAAQNTGFENIKIHMVVQRGKNESQIMPIAHYCRAQKLTLRFVEFMDVGNHTGWKRERVVSSEEITQLLNAKWPLNRIPSNYSGEVVQRWTYQDGIGEIGFVNSSTQSSSHESNHMRLGPDGKFYPCLFTNDGHDIRKLLRVNGSDEEIKMVLKTVWQQRIDHHAERRRGTNDATQTSYDG